MRTRYSPPGSASAASMSSSATDTSSFENSPSCPTSCSKAGRSLGWRRRISGARSSGSEGLVLDEGLSWVDMILTFRMARQGGAADALDQFCVADAGERSGARHAGSVGEIAIRVHVDH